MVFSCYSFLFIFLPFVLLTNRFLSVSNSNLFLLVVSLLFYTIGEGLLVLVLIGSISWNYLMGLWIEAGANDKLPVTIGISGNLLLLAYYKYFGFIASWPVLSDLVASSYYVDILLPIGISFFTFQGISYLVDVYRGTNKAEKNPLRLGLYISFFPQLIAGPIVKYKELASALKHRSLSLDQTTNGAFKFIRGLTKKVILADSLSVFADQIFLIDPLDLPSLLAWAGLLAYSLQIYFDFSGYSDMAIGMCLMLGFQIPENFKHPYVAKSAREFWRRWHISLSSWFRDYLYIPMGGSRVSVYRIYINLIIVFFLTGLWHGASYNFIIWGLIHGVFIVIERISARSSLQLPCIIKHLYLLTVVSLAWVFFRIATLGEALLFIERLFCFTSQGDWYPAIYLNNYFYFILLVSVLFTTPLRTLIGLKLYDIIYNITNLHTDIALVIKCCFYFTLALFCWMELTMSSYSPFIYYKF